MSRKRSSDEALIDSTTKLLRGSVKEYKRALAPESAVEPLDKAIKSQLCLLSQAQRKSLWQTFQNIGGPLTLGSACSGSEVARVAAELVCRNLGVECVTVFACEKVPNKISWITKVDELLKKDGVRAGSDVCVFTDIDNLSVRRAWCALHKSSCAINPVLIFTAGFSCKTMSKLRRSG